MNKDVLITISGIHIDGGEPENVEIITSGSYYKKNGRHYIVYDEVLDDFEGAVHNLIRIYPDCLDIKKSGIANARMTFEKNKKNLSSYATPYGEMMIGINTDSIIIEENENHLNVKVDYSLDINYEKVSSCNMILDVCSRENASLNL